MRGALEGEHRVGSLPVVSVLTEDTLAHFKTAEKVVIAAYVDASDHISNEVFYELAKDLHDDYPFGVIDNDAIAKAEGVCPPAMVVYKSFDEGKNIFADKFEKDVMRAFIVSAATPLTGEVDPETYPVYMSAGIPLAYIFSETSEERNELRDTLKPIAKRFKGRINFATIDATSFGAHANTLNLESKFPSFVIEDITRNQKFPFDQDKAITRDSIDAFVTAFSEVTVVVAKNYNHIVLDDNKDVLIEFYAHWCGHCKAFASDYEDLAAQFSVLKDKVVIAKVDATKNDVPDAISGYPTIKMYPAGAKDDPITYQGPRTSEDLVKFIKEHGRHKAEPSAKEEGTAEDAVTTQGGEQAEKGSEYRDEL
ncbi:disulfide-isomerase precursor [Fusarium albosuccineum]|uniref:Protein disulfide-isomerase n=1 Tax=Fusarium albosuccineum TaxID=1237068 RepID=A0A8H4KHA1_9HYPO|nr:disulfide-isomerase precursor [Fusarium albosuccineum]